MADTPHIMIVEARFYEDIADELARGAGQVLDEAEASHERYSVPGAFDVFSARRRFDGYIALGCVIRGETSHYDIICQESARALQDLMLNFTLALGYGILTVEDREQAMVRASVDQGNKGAGAAKACLEMIGLKRQFHLYPR